MRYIVLLAVGVALLVACAEGGTDADIEVPATATPTATPAIEETEEPDEITARPGHAAVYERIESLEDCAALQAEFDIAMENFDRQEPGSNVAERSLAYAQAADGQMSEIGCYD